jgi:hypothetical protein
MHEGWRGGLTPEAASLVASFFDIDFYLAQCPQIRDTSTEPIVDFLERGWRLGLDPSPKFSTSFYLQAFPDVAASGMNPLIHYVLHGITEGRAPKLQRLVGAISADGHQMPGLDRRRAFHWSDVAALQARSSSAFRSCNRPVIRWIKSNGLDDVVTRSAIAQANELFGDTVDYCLCTAGLPADRVRDILAWATEPVEWWPLSPADNPELAAILLEAGCRPEHFGRWWKWFPERVRPDAPEWILDGDMVVTAKPSWFSAWLEGIDRLRVSNVGAAPLEEIYGDYLDFVDREKRLYSGLMSLRAGQRYMPHVVDILKAQPLPTGHDGRKNMSEQGVLSAAFSRLDATPIPLREFPFARAFEKQLDHGLPASGEPVWGYHFSCAFREENPHFARLVDQGEIFWRNDEPVGRARFQWLMKNRGQWGLAGWSMHPTIAQRILQLAGNYAGKPVLELGTSRGPLAASLSDRGCIVTTVDIEDRGATKNLSGLNVFVVIADAATFLQNSNLEYALITVDVHGNDVPVWRKLWPLLMQRLAKGGSLVLCNSHLWMVPEWKTETGGKWFVEEMLGEISAEVFPEPLPGMIVIKN